MKLHELHSGDIGSGCVRKRDTVAGCACGVGGARPQPSRSTAGEDDRVARHAVPPLGLTVQPLDSNAATVAVDKKASNMRVFDNSDRRLPDAPDQRAFYLEPRSITVRMNDTRARVRGLSSQQQLAILSVEGDTPVNQLPNACRTFFNEHAHCIWMAQASTCGDRVVEVLLRRVLGANCCSNATLCPSAAAIVQLSFCEQRHASARCSGQCRDETCNAASDYNEIESPHVISLNGGIVQCDDPW
jgi:hypothetical protein